MGDIATSSTTESLAWKVCSIGISLCRAQVGMLGHLDLGSGRLGPSLREHSMPWQRATGSKGTPW